MKIKLILLLLCSTSGVFAQSNQSYLIQGTMKIDSLRNSPRTVKKVYLSHEVNGEEVVVDSAVVTNKVFSFRGKAPKFMSPYHISGFDNGTIQVFLEPGTITIQPFDARYPVGAHVKGTPSNDVFDEYKEFGEAGIQRARVRMDKAFAALPADKRNDEKAFYPYQRSTYYVNSLMHRAEAMKFASQHLNSPVVLYIIKYDLFRFFPPKVLEETFMKAMPTAMRQHPMYAELENQLRAANLAEGRLAPDIEGQTPEGKTLRLSDFRGKYVLVDFWASWCGPCIKSLPSLKAMYDKYHGKKFDIIGVSLDDTAADWTAAIAKFGLTWTNVSDLQKWDSQPAKLYAISFIPNTILLDKEGKIIGRNLHVNEIENILNKK